MAENVTMYDLAPSPNSMKVRIALNYKGIEFEKAAVKPRDRSEIVRISGQPLTPVLVHGDRVLFDSAAILRYLDANFRDTPQIFSADSSTMREIERWESIGRGELIQPIGMLFTQFFAPEKSAAELRLASELLHERTAKIEDRLASAEWLVGDKLSAADITVAAPVAYGMLPQAATEGSPIAQFFRDNLELGEGRDRTRLWVGRVLAFDR